jgi:hypothetical protein
VAYPLPPSFVTGKKAKTGWTSWESELGHAGGIFSIYVRRMNIQVESAHDIDRKSSWSR